MIWKRAPRLIVLGLTAGMLAPSWGCGSGSGTPPSLIAVKGKVTYKGKSLTKGVVKFEPDGFGRAATGQLQSDGTFVLGTNKEGDGVVAGSHRVSIVGLDKSLAKDRAMKKYTSPNTSGLTAEVDNDHTEFPFDLKDGR
jgi:hypothetical protein